MTSKRVRIGSARPPLVITAAAASCTLGCLPSTGVQVSDYRSGARKPPLKLIVCGSGRTLDHHAGDS